MGLVKWMVTIAAAVLGASWIASRWVYVDWIGPHLQSQVSLESGAMRISQCFGQLHLNAFYDTSGFHAKQRDHNAPWLWWSWEWSNQSLAPGTGWRAFGLPLWVPALLAGCTAIPLWRTHTRRQRKSSGVCDTCGYDRRGLATDASCPECGSKP